MPDLQSIQQYLSVYRNNNDTFYLGAGSKKNFNLKIAVIGPAHAGKSSLCSQLANDEFPLSYRPTNGVCFYRKKLDLATDQIIANLHLAELGGREQNQDDFYPILNDTRAFIFIFDLTDQSSFDKLQARCLSTWTKRCEFGLLIGNRSDLGTRRHVAPETAEQLAGTLGVDYLEISTKLSTHIKDVMKRLEQIVKKLAYSEPQGTATRAAVMEINKPLAPPRSRKSPATERAESHVERVDRSGGRDSTLKLANDEDDEF